MDSSSSLALLLHFSCLAQFCPYKMCKVYAFLSRTTNLFFKKKLDQTNCPLHLLHIDTNMH